MKPYRNLIKWPSLLEETTVVSEIIIKLDDFSAVVILRPSTIRKQQKKVTRKCFNEAVMDFSSFQERQRDDADVSSCLLFTAQHANSIWYVVWLGANKISQNMHGI